MKTTMNSTLGSLLVIGVVVLIAGTGVAVAQQGDIRADGNPNIDVYLPENTFTPSEATELTLQINNDGELRRGQETDRQLVTTARSVVVDIDPEDAPIEVISGKRSIGSVTEDQPREAGFRIEVPDNAEPGTYEIDIEIDYSYTSRVRQLEGTIDQDQRSRSTTKTVEIEISDDARFRVTNVNSSLRVGEEGDITGTLVNVGGETATNAEVQFPTESSNIDPQETAVAVGDIDAGDSARFRIPIEVSTGAEAVPKRFDLPVSFRNKNGIRTTDDNPELVADIAPERDEFTIEPVDASITSGTTTTIALNITNNKDEPVSNVEPKLFTDSPFSSSNDEAFVESLDPGESTTVSFDLSADSGTTPKIYPVTVDIRYEDASGDSHITDSYRVAIDVAEPAESGGLPIGLISIVVIALGGIGLAVWIRNGI